jgi:hypothetical protein
MSGSKRPAPTADASRTVHMTMEYGSSRQITPCVVIRSREFARRSGPRYIEIESTVARRDSLAVAGRLGKPILRHSLPREVAQTGLTRQWRRRRSRALFFRALPPEGAATVSAAMAYRSTRGGQCTNLARAASVQGRQPSAPERAPARLWHDLCEHDSVLATPWNEMRLHKQHMTSAEFNAALRAAGCVLSEHTADDGATIFRQACSMGLEGIVSKRLSAPYRSGPSRDWLKIKNPDSPAMVRHLEETW